MIFFWSPISFCTLYPSRFPLVMILLLRWIYRFLRFFNFLIFFLSFFIHGCIMNFGCLCFFKIFLCIYGQKLPEQQCMYRTVLHIEYSRTRLLKNSSLERNQKLAISKYLAVQCTYTFQRKEDKVRSFKKEG